MSDALLPKLSLKNCKVLWQDRTTQFFLPFRIESDCLVFAKHTGNMAEDIDRLNRNVHAISLHQLYENLKKNDPHDPIEFDPDKTTIQNTKYSAGSRNEVKRYLLIHLCSLKNECSNTDVNCDIFYLKFFAMISIKDLNKHEIEL